MSKPPRVKRRLRLRDRIILAVLCGLFWAGLISAHGPNDDPTMYFTWFDIGQVGFIGAAGLYIAWRAGIEHEHSKKED